MLDEIVVARFRADAAFAAARLVAVGLDGGALNVARMADGDGHFLVFDQVFELDFLDAVNDLGAARVAIGFYDFAEFGDDNGLQFLFAGQDFAQLGNLFADFFQLGKNVVNGKLRQAVQLQFEDGVNLRKAETCDFGGHAVFLVDELHAGNALGFAVFGNFYGLVGKEFVQVLAGVGAAGGTTDHADDIVEVVERDLVAEQNVFALFGFAQFVLGTAAHHVHAVLDEKAQQVQQAELARLSGDDGQQDHAERFLHLGVLEEVRENNLRLFVALHFDDDAHAVTVGFVANVGDAFDLFVLNEAGDIFDQARFVDLIRELGDDDVLAILAALFDGDFGAHLEGAAARLVGLFDSFAAVNVTGGGKIGARDELHDFFQVGFGFFDQHDRGFNDFFQVVRRNVGGHADGDARGAVDEQAGNPRGQDDGFFFAFIEVGNELDGFFFDVREHFFSDFRKARFGVTHGRGRIAVHGAEVALAVHERVAHVEILREADEGIVHGSVTVRMEFAQKFADDLGTLAISLRGGEAKLVHAEEDAAVHGLEAVADIGESAADDHAHGVIEGGRLHFRVDINRRGD